MQSNLSAPGRTAARSGVLACALAAVSLGACDAVGGRGAATIQLDTAEIQLERGTELHVVHIAGAGSTDSIAPAVVQAYTGDAVRFTTADHRTHAIAFEAARLTPPIREYLERTNQLRGPPLVNRGGAWVVVLEEAPPGRYPFLCRSHGARGMLMVGGD